MRFPRSLMPLTVTLAALAWSDAREDAPWSAAASGGLVSVSDRDGSDVPGGATLGVWVDLLHAALHNWSVGCEGGYSGLPGSSAVIEFAGDESRSLFSASGVVRWRNEGPVRVHLLGALGYYDLATRTHFRTWLRPGGPPLDQVEHERRPGFSLSVGLSGSGPVMPGLRVRWQDVARPDHDLDIVSLEVGLHFN
jgi:hypothetical protein